MSNSDLSNILSSNYMLATLTIRQWSASVNDKEAAAELAAMKGSDARAAKVLKSVLYGADKEFKAVHSAYAFIRTWFYADTVPWVTSEDIRKGPRLVGTMQSMNFLAKFAQLKTQAETARDEFLVSYDDAIQKAAASLGTMYDPALYPSKAELKRLFSATLSLSPVPAGADFARIAIPGAMAQGLQDRYEQRAAVQVKQAVADVQERLIDQLDRLMAQMTKVVSGDKTRLHKTLISNLADLTALAETMAPLSPELGDIAKSVRDALLHIEVEDIKGNAALARSVSSSAEGIKATIVGVPTSALVQPTCLTAADNTFDFDDEDVFNVGI